MVSYMEELRKIIGNNLAELRKRKGLTQLELAEKFNYTDRAVSKWENGDTLPDVEVLYQLCEFYGVTLDYLTHEDNARFVKEDSDELPLSSKISVTALTVSFVWVFAAAVFAISLLRHVTPLWQAFVWAVPVSAIFVTIFNRRFYHRRLISFICLTIFIWSLIASAYLSLLSMNLWPLFLIGIPIQASLFFWLNIKKKPKAESNNK